MFESGLVSVSFRNLSPESIIEQTARAGLHCIEWGGDVHLPPADVERAQMVAERTQAAGLRVSSYGSYFRIGVTPVEQFADLLATASALGAPLVRVWAYDRYLGEYSGKLWDSLVESARLIADMAAKAGIKVCLECHNHTLTEDYHGALRFLQSVGHPALRMYWQPNEHRTQTYNLEAARALADYTECIHVFHWDAQGHYPLSDGMSEWEAYLSVFREELPEKRLPLLLEFMPDNSVESLPTEAVTLKRLIEAVPFGEVGTADKSVREEDK